MECVSDAGLAQGPLYVADPPAGNAWLLLIAGALLFMQAGLFWAGLSAALHAKTDFRAFYTAAHLVVQGRAYELFSYEAQRQAQSALFAASGQTLPFLYPAYAALLFVPFALLPFGVAYLLFTALNLVTLWIAVRLLCERVPTLRRWPPGLRFGLVVALLPLAEVLIQGQISILLLLLYVWMDALLAQRREFLAGVVLAFCLVKFQIAIPVALLFLAWRCYRVLTGFLCGAAGLVLVSLALCGPSGLAAYWRATVNVAGASLFHPLAAKARYGMYAGDMPNLHGLFFVVTHGRANGTILLGLTSVLTLAWASRQRPSLAVALPAAMLVSYHMQVYDLILLLLPFALAANAVPGRNGSRKVGGVTQAAWYGLCGSFACLTIPVAAVMLMEGLASLMALPVLGVMLAASVLVRSGGLDRIPYRWRVCDLILSRQRDERGISHPLGAE
jgi:hypothetical protein